MRIVVLCSIISLFILSIAAYQLDAQTIAWQAENPSAIKGDSIQILETPYNAIGTPAEGVDDYVISSASGDAFVGVPNDGAGDGSWFRYDFNVPSAGDWYLWGKLSAPSVSDNSYHWGIDIDDAQAVAADNGDVNIWDFFEVESLREGYTTDWVWYRLNSRTGAPFAGLEIDQYGDNPTPLELTAGKHTFHLIDREAGTYIDLFFATMDQDFDANVTEPTSVEPADKLTTQWGHLKQVR